MTLTTSDPEAGHAPADGSTVASLLKGSAVPLATLHARYGPLLELVRALIGVVPNCDAYMEIWPPAFRTYNIMVPNLLNLPFAIFGFGGAPADVVGLGMYVASRVAECPYCSAHTCSFSLRRGASAEKVAQAMVGSCAPFTPRELATIAVARSLASVPCELTAAERDALERHCTQDEAGWIVAGISMMGFLNKWMDATGVELEASTAAEVSTLMGASWSAGTAGRGLDPTAPATRPPPADTIWTKLKIIPLLPYALRTDKRWQRGMPDAWPAVGRVLREVTGHDFPVLSRVRHGRVVQSVGSMLRENLDPTTSVIGLGFKVVAGVVFATVVCDTALLGDVRALADRNGVNIQRLEAATRFATSPDAPPPSTDPRERAALLLVRAASPSPAAIDATIIDACREADLQPAALVEIVTWLSVLQLLHRLSSYHIAPAGPTAPVIGTSAHSSR